MLAISQICAASFWEAKTMCEIENKKTTLSDDQIIFSLVCHEDWNGMCEQCPYTPSKACAVQLARNARELIIRQRTEIARLTKLIGKTAATAREEGIEELAEKLKSNLDDVVRVEMVGGTYYPIGKSFIDKAAAELLEVGNGKSD